MSIEQRELLKKLFELTVKGVFVVLGWFLVNSFYEVKSDITEMKKDLKQIEGRLIRVETKLER